MSRSGKPETRSTTAMQEEQINLSLDELEKLRGEYAEYAQVWDYQAKNGTIPQRALAEIKKLLGVV